MPYVTVQGHRTHYVSRQPPATGGVGAGHGDGSPVFFIHGAGGSHQHWLYQVRDLAPLATWAVDLPGHGRSEGQGRDDISAYSEWVVAFLDEMAANLDTEKGSGRQAVLVGHSMGGAIALDVALRYPDRIRGLGLVGTGARLPVAPAILDGIRKDYEATLQLINGWTFGPDASPEMVRLGQRQLAATPADVLYGDFAACDAFDVTGRLGEVRVPTMVLCGTRDIMTPSKYSIYLRDHIDGSVLHFVEGAGHMVMVEYPGAVARALRAFLGVD